MTAWRTKSPFNNKTPKYGNKKTIVDGIEFDSQKEAKHYEYLRMLRTIGEISALERQKTFRLEVNNQLICKYIADFAYIKNGNEIIVDVKSNYTRKLPVYSIKKKLMKAIYNIDILEV